MTEVEHNIIRDPILVVSERHTMVEIINNTTILPLTYKEGKWKEKLIIIIIYIYIYIFCYK